MPNCPTCNAPNAYIGFTSVDCTNAQCKNFRAGFNGLNPNPVTSNVQRDTSNVVDTTHQGYLMPAFTPAGRGITASGGTGASAQQLSRRGSAVGRVTWYVERSSTLGLNNPPLWWASDESLPQKFWCYNGYLPSYPMIYSWPQLSKYASIISDDDMRDAIQKMGVIKHDDPTAPLP
jgi:hypothetical protein